MHSDPIADMLTRLRNASRARHERVRIPFSKQKLNFAAVLKEEGFVVDFREVSGERAVQELGRTKKRKAGGVIHDLEVKLKYDKEGEPVILKLQRISKPGLRRYFKCDEIPKVLGGLGCVVLTTSKGIMTDRKARKERVGGEALCAIY